MPTLILISIALFSLSYGFHYLSLGGVDPQASLDSSYYHLVAERLLQGKGFTEPFIWYHLREFDALTHPLDYWQPLGIVLYAGARGVAGVEGEILMNRIAWALLAILVFHEVRKKFGNWFLAFLAFLFTSCAGKYGFYIATTDNVMFYAVMGFFLFRNLATRVDGNRAELIRQGILVGFVTALMSLTRVEGVFFAFLGFLWLPFKLKNWKGTFAGIAIFALTVSPWVARNLMVTGKPWPSNPKAFFLHEYKEMFELDFPGTFENFAKKGWGPIVAQKLDGIRKNMADLFMVPNHILLAPFWVFGIWTLWNSYGAVLLVFHVFFLLVCGILFTVQSLQGTTLHLASAFLPANAIVVAGAFDGCFRGFISHWTPNLKRSLVLLFGAWIVAFSLMGAHYSISSYTEAKQPYKDFLSKNPIPREDRVVSSFPMYVNVISGNEGVLAPYIDPRSTVVLADRFSCDWILIDTRAHTNIASSYDGFVQVASESPFLLFRRAGQ